MNSSRLGLLAALAALCIGTSGLVVAQDNQVKADPIIGTWKLNPSQSKVTAGTDPVAFPKEHIEVYRYREPTSIELTLTRTNADGTRTMSTLSWPAEGGLVTRLQGNAPQSQVLVETLVGPGEWRVTYLRGGRQYLTMQTIIAADGRTMRQIVRGIDAQGKPFESVQGFDRQ